MEQGSPTCTPSTEPGGAARARLAFQAGTGSLDRSPQLLEAPTTDRLSEEDLNATVEEVWAEFDAHLAKSNPLAEAWALADEVVSPFEPRPSPPTPSSPPQALPSSHTDLVVEGVSRWRHQQAESLRALHAHLKRLNELIIYAPSEQKRLRAQLQLAQYAAAMGLSPSTRQQIAAAGRYPSRRSEEPRRASHQPRSPSHR